MDCGHHIKGEETTMTIELKELILEQAARDSSDILELAKETDRNIDVLFNWIDTYETDEKAVRIFLDRAKRGMMKIKQGFFYLNDSIESIGELETNLKMVARESKGDGEKYDTIKRMRKPFPPQKGHVIADKTKYDRRHDKDDDYEEEEIIKDVSAEELQEIIVKQGNEWCVKSEKKSKKTGKRKNMGCYPSKEKAHERLGQVEWFKSHPKG